MTFLDWCKQVYGILDFSEAKIPNNIYLPASSSAPMIIPDPIAAAGGYLVETPFMRGLIIPSDTLKQITNPHHFFPALGFDETKQIEYREASKIHIAFKNEESKEYFYEQFSGFEPKYTFNEAFQEPTLELSPYIIDYLKKLYYVHQDSSSNRRDYSAETIRQTKLLFKLQTELQKNGRTLALEQAHNLSMDYTNRFALQGEAAVDAYALSLRIFAQLNEDNLSKCDYQLFQSVSALLVAYDEAGKLKQSLLTDVAFIRDLNAQFDSFKKKYMAPIEVVSQLSPEDSNALFSLIEKNTKSLMYGKLITMSDGHVYKASRFYPDEHMQSETNEIVLLAGGQHEHFAIVRIIKIGMLQNGSHAEPGQTPDFFTYYRVENNLGAGSKGFDSTTQSCYGCSITQLIPGVYHDGQLIFESIDPVINPQEYQKRMKTTIWHLICTERRLMLYRSSESSIMPGQNSLETQEWNRLNTLKNILSGQPVANKPLNYFTADPSNSEKLQFRRLYPYLKTFIQQGGSCLVFSLKSFVASLMGSNLTFLHINFMQLNNGAEHCNKIEGKLKKLKDKVVESGVNRSRSTSSFFKYNELEQPHFSLVAEIPSIEEVQEAFAKLN